MSKQSMYGHLRFPMRRFLQSASWLWYFVLFLSVLTACGRSVSPATAPVDQSTPEATVRALYEATDRGDVELFGALLAPNDEWNQASLKGLKFVLQKGIMFETTNISIDVVENDGKRARVRTYYHEVIRSNGQIDVDHESGGLYTLDRIGDRWYFVGLGQQPSPPGWVQPNELPPSTSP